MKKKWTVSLAALVLAAAAAMMAGGQALAVEWYPSRTQSEVSIAESTAAAPDGSVITVTQAPWVGTGEAGQQVADAAEHLIQVTPVSVTLAANAAVEAANPGAGGDQLADTPTASGLSYAANGQLNHLYGQVMAAASVQQLLADLAPDAAADFQEMVGEEADAYAPVARGGSVEIAVSVPGVTDGTRLTAVSWDQTGKSCLTPVRAAGNAVRLTVRSSGPVLILARLQG